PRLPTRIPLGDSVEDRSTESSASITEGHPRKLFLQSSPLACVRSLSEPTGEQEESFFLSISGLQAGLDQVYEHDLLDRRKLRHRRGPPALPLGNEVRHDRGGQRLEHDEA